MSICGNGVVEDGEECDCGWEEDCQEECCWPQRTKYSKNQIPCTLRPSRICSPSQVMIVEIVEIVEIADIVEIEEIAEIEMMSVMMMTGTVLHQGL